MWHTVVLVGLRVDVRTSRAAHRSETELSVWIRRSNVIQRGASMKSASRRLAYARARVENENMIDNSCVTSGELPTRRIDGATVEPRDPPGPSAAIVVVSLDPDPAACSAANRP